MNKLCECGCDQGVTNEKNRFLIGHGNRGRKHTSAELEKMSKSHIGKKQTLEQKLKNSISNKGRIVSEETRLKLSLTNKGRPSSEKCKLIAKQMMLNNTLAKGYKHTQQWKEEQSKRFRGRKGTWIGKKHSEESKLKMGISQIKRIERQYFNGGPIHPCIGNNERYILDQFQENIKYQIIRNSIDIFKKSHKFPDGYIQELNLCIDVLESDHYRKNNELRNSDKYREIILSSRLGCMIYYVPEQEFLRNPEKEIQRLKNFLLLLNEGRN